MAEKEQALSKYARKQLEKQRGNWQPPAAQVSVTVELPPQNPPQKKEKKAPPEPRGLVADLGLLPANCAAMLHQAETLLNGALKIAQSMQAKAKRGRQSGEVLALVGIISVLPARAAYGAARAAGIPNMEGLCQNA